MNSTKGFLRFSINLKLRGCLYLSYLNGSHPLDAVTSGFFDDNSYLARV